MKMNAIISSATYPSHKIRLPKQSSCLTLVLLTLSVVAAWEGLSFYLQNQILIVFER
jgi:hypothetical protein